MRHDWVFDVLSDLLDYATRNGLTGLAAKVSDAIATARREIDAGEAGQDEPSQVSPPKGRPMH
ncbi:MAG: hypothetical protein ACK40I_08340 [Tabrizicola sp.]